MSVNIYFRRLFKQYLSANQRYKQKQTYKCWHEYNYEVYRRLCLACLHNSDYGTIYGFLLDI